MFQHTPVVPWTKSQFQSILKSQTKKFKKNVSFDHYPTPIIRFRNLRKSRPCNGLVIKSPTISPVGQYSTARLPFSCWSVRKKYRIFNALDLFPALLFPFFINRIVLLLSWYNIFRSIVYPCSSRKSFVHNIFVAMSSAPTSSASQLLRVFNFCLLGSYPLQ